MTEDEREQFEKMRNDLLRARTSLSRTRASNEGLQEQLLRANVRIRILEDEIKALKNDRH